MNARVVLENGSHVATVINEPSLGVDEIWLEEYPDLYIYAADYIVDVFRSGPAPQFLGEYRVYEDTASGNWFVYPFNDPNQRVAHGLSRLHVLGRLLLQLGGHT